VSPVKYEKGFYIAEDTILHSHCSENLKYYIALTGWTLQWRHNVSPVKYELRYYISEAVKTSILTQHSAVLRTAMFIQSQGRGLQLQSRRVCLCFVTRNGRAVQPATWHVNRTQ
jgi:hypothetical protein